MDRRLNGPTGPSSSVNGGPATRSGSHAPQPNYNSRAVQEALEQLASIDLIDLCNESKVECCRATRDLRSCGRQVKDVLISCGHASLCAECSQRCDVCPICRIQIPKNGAKLCRRLYDQCLEAHLIPKRCDKSFQEKEDGEEQISADVQRLYSLFDIALENNLVSLICHYVTDVCLDESAVSSDPVIAFLLDEVVVKDWCKRTFQNIITELQGIYNLEAEPMKSMLSLLLKFSVQLAGISSVIEVLDSSFKGSFSAQLHDFHQLQESILKTKQEACHLLPEISGPATHPKIAQVLLERGNSDTALLVLRWSGRDGTSKSSISLGEAVTAVRVRVECGLFTEAFIHQRMLCTKVKEKMLKLGELGDATDDSKSKYGSWEDWVEILITEICVLCIRRNMVDRVIELPWNSDEEKHLHKCLLDYTIDDPSSTIGSLLVVFYIQRYRYSEAYQVDQILKNLEEEFISKNSVSEEVSSRMRSMSRWRAGLIDKCMELLPEVQRQEIKSGKFPEVAVTTSSEVETAAASLPEVQKSQSISMLIPSSIDSSLGLWSDCVNPSWKPSISETPKKRVGLVDSYRSELGNNGSVLHEKLLSNSETQWKPDDSINKAFNFEDASTPGIHWATPPSSVKDRKKSSSRILSNSRLQDNQYARMSPKTERNKRFNPFQNTSPSNFYSADSNPVTTPSSNRGLFKDSATDLHRSVNSKGFQRDRDNRTWNMASKDDPMDISLSYGEKSHVIEDENLNNGPRWRSDEASDEEEEQSPQKAIGITRHASTARALRRTRFSKR
ncbi:E3 ubiquitin-protein ligase HOS1-like isoform X3 [Malus sylvestris]|uniref:E3 ubiquitin-protein ligase HOS1-like isoform X3 n=1 Tax=Malus sylvestris TaxID=3752 RepID=UPI0021AC6B53|nr:E3 ubiquitin-protein ligase HOS1-like isoform X3 [Malus sylvestris]